MIGPIIGNITALTFSIPSFSSLLPANMIFIMAFGDPFWRIPIGMWAIVGNLRLSPHLTVKYVGACDFLLLCFRRVKAWLALRWNSISN